MCPQPINPTVAIWEYPLRQRGNRSLPGRVPPGWRRARLPLGVVGEPLPVDDDARLVTDDPRVVPRRHDGEVAGAVFRLFTVVHDDLHPPRDEVAQRGRLDSSRSWRSASRAPTTANPAGRWHD